MGHRPRPIMLFSSLVSVFIVLVVTGSLAGAPLPKELWQVVAAAAAAASAAFASLDRQDCGVGRIVRTDYVQFRTARVVGTLPTHPSSRPVLSPSTNTMGLLRGHEEEGRGLWSGLPQKHASLFACVVRRTGSLCASRAPLVIHISVYKVA